MSVIKLKSILKSTLDASVLEYIKTMGNPSYVRYYQDGSYDCADLTFEDNGDKQKTIDSMAEAINELKERLDKSNRKLNMYKRACKSKQKTIEFYQEPTQSP